MTPFQLIILFVILILLSAFFSSLETALFHLKSYNKINSTTRELLKNPKKLLATLLTGNTIVNIGLGSIAATYALILHSELLNANIISPGNFLRIFLLLKNTRKSVSFLNFFLKFSTLGYST